MVFNTVSVSTAVTPKIIETCFSHYLNRKPLQQKPTAHISYHEGINLVRQFLVYASHHTVEDIQGFTSQWVPSPQWVKVDEVEIPPEAIADAAQAICTQLGHKGVDQVGGRQWWQWRREGSKLQSEWIEMKRDYNKRKASGVDSKRVMMYIHGGAYFFGSVDAHRYQLQRHARKLEAKLFAREIVLAGDSAGGGMLLSLMVILRDQGMPLPAGAILISPWVDLTHSFPSVAGDGSLDYIPAHGFMQRPSASWPPPNSDDIENIARHAVEKVVEDTMPRKSSQAERKHATEDATQGFSIEHPSTALHSKGGKHGTDTLSGNTIPRPGRDLSIVLDGKLVTIKDQIQMYTTNQLIAHPLVSPILQPSLGGLPPLLILTGGGEVLRDEQIYLAHKAASPSKYPPGEVYLRENPDAQSLITRFKPTDVQLQVWDDLCHVAPTLSFTRPAKYMYRSVAQFGAWALARAQQTEIDIQDDDAMSVISSDSNESDNSEKAKRIGTMKEQGSSRIGRAGEPLPPFKNHMIRQRVDRHGNISPLDHPTTLAALQVHPNEIGAIKPGPVSKWLKAKIEWDSRYAREKRKVQKRRALEMAAGYRTFGDGEVPPPSALAGRRGLDVGREEKKGRSWGMSIWSLWGSSHDEQTMEREAKADRDVKTTTTTAISGAADGPLSGGKMRERREASRSISRRRNVADLGQSGYRAIDNNNVHEDIPAAASETEQSERASQLKDVGQAQDHTHTVPTFLTTAPTDQAGYDGVAEAEDAAIVTTSLNRPVAGPGKAFPFKLGTQLSNDGGNASTVTLESHVGIAAVGAEPGKQTNLLPLVHS